MLLTQVRSPPHWLTLNPLSYINLNPEQGSPPGWTIFGFARFKRSVKKHFFFVFPVLAVHKPYYFLYFSQLFFCHKFRGFLCISCKGCPQTILFLVRNRWSRYLPGSFRMGEQLDLSFYFMSCLCRYMVGYFCKLRPASISLWIPTLGADIFTDISVP